MSLVYFYKSKQLRLGFNFTNKFFNMETYIVNVSIHLFTAVDLKWLYVYNELWFHINLGLALAVFSLAWFLPGLTLINLYLT
jgi:hypothetical protein